MKGAVIYSSKTGNTKKVAEAIRNALSDEFTLYNVTENPNPEDFDLIFMGYWVDKGTANVESLEFMKAITHKKVALFATLGDYAHTDHAQNSLAKGAECLGENCDVIDSFICQGAIDPKLIEWMKQLPADHPHAPDEARIKKWDYAASKPDADDLENAGSFAVNTVTKLIG